MDCAWYGEYICEGKNNNREPEACGNLECQREVRQMYREMEEAVRERAADDDYNRYR